MSTRAWVAELVFYSSQLYALIGIESGLYEYLLLGCVLLLTSERMNEETKLLLYHRTAVTGGTWPL